MSKVMYEIPSNEDILYADIMNRYECYAAAKETNTLDTAVIPIVFEPGSIEKEGEYAGTNKDTVIYISDGEKGKNASYYARTDEYLILKNGDIIYSE